MTNKKIRKLIKKDKRITKLLYKKGLLEKFNIPYNELYWDTLHKPNKNVNKWILTISHCTFDYWGECDDYSLINRIMEYLYYENIDRDPMDFDEDPQPMKSNLNLKSRHSFLKYLNTLPNKINNSKINKYLNTGVNI